MATEDTVIEFRMAAPWAWLCCFLALLRVPVPGRVGMFIAAHGGRWRFAGIGGRWRRLSAYPKACAAGRRPIR